MNFESVTSKDNQLIKNIKKLISSPKERREQKAFILEGLRLCSDAAINGCRIDTVIVSESAYVAGIPDVLQTAAAHRVKVPDHLFSSVCDTVSPQGIMCIAAMPNTVFSGDSIPDGKYILLENTADPSNLGAVSRTAEALGISGLIVSSSGCDPFSPKALRASMGALLRLPVYISGNIADTVAELHKSDFRVFASVVRNADADVTAADFSGNCAVLVGNEANGLTDGIISLCDEMITITMRGRAESLNAAAAASIIMWEMSKAGD